MSPYVSVAIGISVVAMTIAAGVTVKMAVTAAEMRRLTARRPALDCGDPDDGRPIYFCVHCNWSRCEQHRNGGHLCRCSACLGFGEVLKVPCWPCGGSGKQWKEPVA